MAAHNSLSRLLIATCITATAASTAVAAVAPKTGVRLYTEANYSGRTLQFSPNKTYSTTLQAKDQNKISSLEVPTGLEVTLIDSDRPQQKSVTFGPGQHSSIGDDMNNKADMVIVSRDSSRATASVVVFDFPSFDYVRSQALA